MKQRLILWLLAAVSVAGNAFDYEGHHLINQLAITALSADFPAFAKTEAARTRIGFLGGEADRWRNSNELPFRHASNPDHYFDIDDLAPYGIPAEQLTPFRYEFVAQINAIRAADPKNFPPPDPMRDPERVRQLPGFLPWAITEYYGKLESAFSYLKAYQENGTPDEIANAQENVIYVMGVMGHFVADAAQPLHTTTNYNGWNGPNPKGYTTNRTFHSWVDGGFLAKTGMPAVSELQSKLRPAKALWTLSTGTNSPVFARVVQYIADQYKLVEPLYQLEKDGKMAETEGPASEGRKFICQQLAAGAQMLADLWQTAWQQAPPDAYLKSQLAMRAKPGSAAPKP